MEHDVVQIDKLNNSTNIVNKSKLTNKPLCFFSIPMYYI